METTTETAAHEAEVRELLRTLQQGIERKDVAAVMACYAEEVVTFNLAPPLQTESIAESRKTLEAWFDGYETAIGYEMRETQVAVAGDVAFAYGLNHVTGRLKTGQEVSMWIRSTLGLRRRAGGWRIVHEHVSDPVDMATGKALFGLEP